MIIAEFRHKHMQFAYIHQTSRSRGSKNLKNQTCMYVVLVFVVSVPRHRCCLFAPSASDRSAQLLYYYCDNTHCNVLLNTLSVAIALQSSKGHFPIVADHEQFKWGIILTYTLHACICMCIALRAHAARQSCTLNSNKSQKITTIKCAMFMITKEMGTVMFKYVVAWGKCFLTKIKYVYNVCS